MINVTCKCQIASFICINLHKQVIRFEAGTLWLDFLEVFASDHTCNFVALKCHMNPRRDGRCFYD